MVCIASPDPMDEQCVLSGGSPVDFRDSPPRESLRLMEGGSPAGSRLMSAYLLGAYSDRPPAECVLLTRSCLC